ncbi:hypothetical protein, conserved [Trypanosoma brucei gambiense DAL972]|uniref:Thioesterase domain-containing protein n=2 Tax=Trypanosoma brucei TaxID=5691 RepID=D0A1Q1_TRYB9|nr:hypothetical protein, conserved [Trypanosoma brucei gambiense DAL972]RHW68895.1 hypothetical protein DPX39_100028800 [Trypanosoma brucei equiperdum]CBH15194.1 hypothetical protein, conserved [Trypanosoma brucei gambiense DAL972]|eukprot:XP_011777459.1 hypothetical protein, conserved [Trypanosoma brucei gambiense DAL972]
MFSRHSLWVPAASHFPKFVEHFNRFLKASPHNVELQKALCYKEEETQLLIIQDPKARQPIFAMAFPFTVTPALCDGSRMGLGTFTSLVDTTTSLHVAAALLPTSDMHVSVSLQTNCVQPITAGEKVVMISRMDKFGKRLAFLSARLLRLDDVYENTVAPTAGRELEELERQLSQYQTLANGTHVKCILNGKS